MIQEQLINGRGVTNKNSSCMRARKKKMVSWESERGPLSGRGIIRGSKCHSWESKGAKGDLFFSFRSRELPENVIPVGEPLARKTEPSQ